MAPRPVPVMCEQLPVTEGIFRDEITKTKAPEMAMRGQGSAVFLYRIPQGEKARQQKGEADNAPGDAESRGKISLHDVHSMGGGEDPQAQGQAGSDGCQFLLRFLSGYSFA